MTRTFNFYSLQLKIKATWSENLEKLESLVRECEDNSFILASEVFLTGFAYQRMQEASDFGKIATSKLQELSVNKTIGITMIEKEGQGYVNRFKLFSKGRIIHTQSKVKLFPLGQEHLHFKAGKIEDIKPFMVDDVKCGILNCFEIRFPSLWERLRGASVIFIPVAWGKSRKVHLQTLTRAIAIANQCFVIVSSCAGSVYARGSCIVTPYGTVYKNDSKEIIKAEVNLGEADKMRSHIDTGIPQSIATESRGRV